MKKTKKTSEDRRSFLKGVATGAVASLVTGKAAASAVPLPAEPQRATAPVPAPETDPVGAEVLTVDRPGADFMTDVIKSLGFEYIASNPGSSFRALQESLINYGGNRNPEWLTCCHEESSVAMAHGYAEVEGKPMLTMAHSTVGLQHAAMAVYNAYAGRVPVYIILGNTLDAAERRPGVEWMHSAQDAAAMVRDYTKWDDCPVSLRHFAESVVRAYKISMTLPRMPVVIVADSGLQERPIHPGEKLEVPKFTLDAHPQGDSGAVRETARLLVQAQNPVILAGRVARSQEGAERLAELAELLQAAVIDRGENLPSRFPLLSSGAVVSNADVLLALEHENLWGSVNRMRDQVVRDETALLRPASKVISIRTGHLFLQSNYQDFQRYVAADLEMAADSETTLPSLIEEVKKLITADRRRAYQERGAKLAEASQRAWERQRGEAVYGWNASPISTARLSAEVWNAVKNEDWALVGRGEDFRWNVTRYYQRRHGGYAAGVGFHAPSAVGAALAHRRYGRFSVHIQNDGDLMYAPGVLWTAAHHKIPLLAVMHNNRAYHQEVMHLQRMSSRHQRGITTAGIGNVLTEPDIDYAKLAQSMGWYAEGPITNPNDLGPALKRAVEVVKRGEPALIDSVTQPR
jgi:thiamine pyrophosphate-dependent acetolactate synthase large subunit-like protein